MELSTRGLVAEQPEDEEAPSACGPGQEEWQGQRIEENPLAEDLTEGPGTGVHTAASASAFDPAYSCPNEPLTMTLSTRSSFMVRIDGLDVLALIDTGADFNLTTLSLLQRLPAYNENLLLSCDLEEIVTADRHPTKVLGTYWLDIEVRGHRYPVEAHVLRRSVYPLILGTEFCNRYQATLDFGAATMTLQPPTKLYLEKKLRFGPGECFCVTAKGSRKHPLIEGTEGVIYPLDEDPLIGMRIEEVLGVVQDGNMALRLTNMTLAPRTIPPTVAVAKFWPLEEEDQIWDPSRTEDVCQPDCGMKPPPSVCAVTRGPAHPTPEEDQEDISQINLTGARLNADEKQQLKNLIHRYRTAFVNRDGTVGRTQLIQHNITLKPEAKPVWQQPRPLGYHDRQDVLKSLSDMTARGVVEPAQSAWASPIVLVRKKNGSVRFCVDYRRLNQATIDEPFPMPNTQQSYLGGELPDG